MKNMIRLMTFAAVCCSFGCNGTTERTGTPSADQATSAKQNTQPQSAAKPESSATSTGPLDGTWVSNCTAEGDVYLVLTDTFAGDNGYQQGAIYSDSACQQAMEGATVNPAWLQISIGETDPKTGLTPFTEQSTDTTGTKTSMDANFQLTDNGNTLTMTVDESASGTYPGPAELVFTKQAKTQPIPPQP